MLKPIVSIRTEFLDSNAGASLKNKIGSHCMEEVHPRSVDHKVEHEPGHSGHFSLWSCFQIRFVYEWVRMIGEKPTPPRPHNPWILTFENLSLFLLYMLLKFMLHNFIFPPIAIKLLRYAGDSMYQ